jgi:hypothetical protein
MPLDPCGESVLALWRVATWPRSRMLPPKVFILPRAFLVIFFGYDTGTGRAGSHRTKYRWTDRSLRTSSSWPRTFPRSCEQHTSCAQIRTTRDASKRSGHVPEQRYPTGLRWRQHHDASAGHGLPPLRSEFIGGPQQAGATRSTCTVASMRATCCLMGATALRNRPPCRVAEDGRCYRASRTTRAAEIAASGARSAAYNCPRLPVPSAARMAASVRSSWSCS